MNKNISDNDLIKRLILSGASFLTAYEKLYLLQNGYNILHMTLDEISVTVGRSIKRALFYPAKLLKDAENSLRIINSMNLSYVSMDDEAYPAMLTEMKDPPFMLFYRGNLDVLKKKCVSVVGTRRCGLQGRKAAEEFSRQACNDGCCIVSGLAYGIDGAAHKGALMADTPCTCAVLPSGIDIITPQSHKKLAAKILESGGLIISEYLPGTPALAFRFVQRNRIVAALSAETVVIQAPCGSGAMITAGLALDYNRAVFFHNECFLPEGLALCQISELELRKELAQGKKVEYKINNSPESFVQDGAVVISNYDDFKKAVESDCCFFKCKEATLFD